MAFRSSKTTQNVTQLKTLVTCLDNLYFESLSVFLIDEGNSVWAFSLVDYFSDEGTHQKQNSEIFQF